MKFVVYWCLIYWSALPCKELGVPESNNCKVKIKDCEHSRTYYNCDSAYEFYSIALQQRNAGREIDSVWINSTRIK